jgi:hypothetical protein
MKELQKMTAILRDTPLSRTMYLDTEKERHTASWRGMPIGAMVEGVSQRRKNLL